MPVVKDDPKAKVAGILAGATKKYNLKAGPMNQILTDVKSIPTGNIAIDAITGVNGLPMGRCIEGFGPPSSGKTTTGIQAAAALQNIILSGGDPDRGISPDDLIVYMDYEHSMDPRYCKKLGLDTDHSQFIFVQPDNFEDGANFIREITATGLVRLIIFDSVAHMTPSARLEAETGKSLPAIQARLMSEFLAAFVPLLHEHNTTAFFVNHIREVMEMSRPGMPKRTSTPGGSSLKFMASLRIEYKQLQNIKTKVKDLLTQETIERITSTNVAVKIVKNKVGPPFTQAIVRVRFGKGFDNFFTAMQILMANKVVMYQPGIFKFHKVEAEGLAPDWMVRMTVGAQPPVIKGEEALFKAAEQHPEWAAAIIARAERVVAELGLDAFDQEEEDVEDGIDTELSEDEESAE